MRLVNAEDSVGVGIGMALIDGIYYATFRPELNLHFDNFHLGLGSPLRFEVYDTNVIDALDPTSLPNGFSNVGTFRARDWDRFVNSPYTDLLRPLKYLTYGRKEDRLYGDVSRGHALTTGHGQILRRSPATVDVDAGKSSSCSKRVRRNIA